MLNRPDHLTAALLSRARPDSKLDPSPLRLCAACGAPTLGRVHADVACAPCLQARARMIRSVYSRMQAQNKIAALDPFLDECAEEDAHGRYDEEEAFCL